jgi:hypothetical protein
MRVAVTTLPSLMLTVAMLLAGGAANADNLKGTYSFVGNDNCFLTSNPLIPPPPALRIDSNNGTFTAILMQGGAQGFATFDGKGTGSISESGSWLSFRTDQGLVPDGDLGFASLTSARQFNMGPFQFTVAFMYTVNGDGFTLTETSRTGNFQTAVVPAGLRSATGMPTVNGTISANKKNPILQTFTGTPAQEFWAFSDGTNAYVACLRSRIYTKVK